MMKTRLSAMFIVSCLLTWTGTSLSLAQAVDTDPKRKEIEADFQKDLVKAEEAKIARLGQLAATQPPAEASTTYNDLFRFAIGAGLYEAAEPFAEKVITTEVPSHETLLLAQMVNVVAEANRGAFDESLASLAKAVQVRADTPKGDKPKFSAVLPLPAKMSLINVYIQRLIHARQYDIARKALTMIAGVAEDPQVKNLVAKRLVQVELVGKPSPPILGKDLDGKALNLGDYKGSLVLVVFWASWCTPNHQEALRFEELGRKYREKGFRIIGVNLDAHQEGGVSVASVMPAVRRYLVENNVSWPNLLSTTDGQDYAKLFGVTELPTDVLIGRDGTILHLDVDVDTLEKLLPTLISK